LNLCKAHFTLGVRANFQPKSSIPIGAKVEIGPKGLPDAKYPLTSSVQRWFHLSFCIPFFGVAQFCNRRVYFLYLLDTQGQKGQKFKNPAAKQRSSLQGCTVRPETSAGQSSFGVFSISVRAT
jgi:hypothetical protein